MEGPSFEPSTKDEGDQMAAIQLQVDEAKGALVQSFVRVVERQEKLENLDKRLDNLEAQAAVFDTVDQKKIKKRRRRKRCTII